mgnify:CR=1 FL=1
MTLARSMLDFRDSGMQHQIQAAFTNRDRRIIRTALGHDFYEDYAGIKNGVNYMLTHKLETFEHVGTMLAGTGTYGPAGMALDLYNPHRFDATLSRFASMQHAASTWYGDFTSSNPARNDKAFADILHAGSFFVAPEVARPVVSAVSRFGVFGRGVGELSTGGRQIETVSGWTKTEKQASRYYKKIRAMSSNADVASISKNTRMPEYRIQRIKEHLFFNKHKLTNGKISRFDPDIEVADAWERLKSGSFVQQDLALLQHEYFESRFEALYNTDYITAHNAAELSGRVWDPDEFETAHNMMWRP